MLGGEIVERQQRFPVLGETGGCLVVFGLILGPNRSKTFSASLRPSAIRGRDGCYQPPPAQIRTSGTPASGSYLECLTAKRCCGQG